jgi:hypothetical protein
VSNVLVCICKDGVGTITDVEGNINWAMYVDIFDNNRFRVLTDYLLCHLVNDVAIHIYTHD